MVFDPDHFAKEVIRMQSWLWDAFMDWYAGRETQGGFLDKANQLNKEYEQYFLDLQKGAKDP